MTNCPNCGHPFDGDRCEYCGTNKPYRLTSEINLSSDGISFKCFRDDKDLVHVVRCAECKYARKPSRKDCEKNNVFDGTLVCTSYHNMDDGPKFVYGDSYCSLGERV